MDTSRRSLAKDDGTILANSDHFIGSRRLRICNHAALQAGMEARHREQPRMDTRRVFSICICIREAQSAHASDRSRFHKAIVGIRFRKTATIAQTDAVLDFALLEKDAVVSVLFSRLHQF